LPTVDPVPGRTGTAAGIAAWLLSPPLRALVTRFGGTVPDGPTGDVLAVLDDFSARHWDFRGGRERPEAREPDLDAVTVAQVRDTARALGLVDPVRPARTRYTHLLVLGGLAHACLRRTAYAAHLLRTGTDVDGEVAVLGSGRPLSDAERATVATAGLGHARTESDALAAGVRAAFGVDRPAWEDGRAHPDPHRAWSSRTYRPAGGPPVRVLSAPSGDPAVRRAHTADTQRFWAGRVALSPGDTLLLVTAPVYVPFQHCDALRTLAVPYGCRVETVGVDPAAAGPAGWPEPTPTPGRYLQEIRSAIRSLRALHAALGNG
jgi:hypothetical protein